MDAVNDGIISASTGLLLLTITCTDDGLLYVGLTAHAHGTPWKFLKAYVAKSWGASGTTGNPGGNDAKCMFTRLSVITWKCPCSCFTKGASGTCNVTTPRQKEAILTDATGPFATVALNVSVPIPGIPHIGVDIEIKRDFTMGGRKAANLACAKSTPKANEFGLVKPYTCTVL